MKKLLVEMNPKFWQPAHILLIVPFELIHGAEDVGAHQIACHVGFYGFVNNKPVGLQKTRKKAGRSVATKTPEPANLNFKSSRFEFR
jgi:hypothetical protein